MQVFEKNPINKVVRGPKRATYSKEEIYQILDDAFLCHVGYVWQDRAIVIPTAYGRNGDKLYIHGSMKNRMMLHLAEAGVVGLTITHLDGLVLARSAFHHSANYRSVSIFGNVRIVEDEEEKMEGLACILNHMVSDHWDYVRQPNEKEMNATLVLEITIEDASAKIRAEGVNDEKMDLNSDYWAGVVPIRQIAMPAESDHLLKDGITVPPSVLRYVEDNQMQE